MAFILNSAQRSDFPHRFSTYSVKLSYPRAVRHSSLSFISTKSRSKASDSAAMAVILRSMRDSHEERDSKAAFCTMAGGGLAKERAASLARSHCGTDLE